MQGLGLGLVQRWHKFSHKMSWNTVEIQPVYRQDGLWWAFYCKDCGKFEGIKLVKPRENPNGH